MKCERDASCVRVRGQCHSCQMRFYLEMVWGCYIEKHLMIHHLELIIVGPFVLYQFLDVFLRSHSGISVRAAWH